MKVIDRINGVNKIMNNIINEMNGITDEIINSNIVKFESNSNLTTKFKL